MASRRSHVPRSSPFRPRSVLALAAALLIPGALMAVEEPAFTVEKKHAGFEIRTYGETVVAETEVRGDFEDAGNAAFRRLAGYIFGGNRSQSKIAMTAPVTQSAASQKIAMTAPVTQRSSVGGHLVQFTMPAGSALETLPTPDDPSVTLRKIPARRVAVLRYAGSWSEARYLEKLAELRQALRNEQLTEAGEPVFARFNSPWQLPFLRRNEIWLDLKPD